MVDKCDIYLFCLWHESKPWWRMFLLELGSAYDINMVFKSFFPNDLDLVRRFYNNENLISGYQRKLDGMIGEFIFCICHDRSGGDLVKLSRIKSKLRSVRNRKIDYNLIHGSESLSEFMRQVNIIGRLSWQKVIHT